MKRGLLLLWLLLAAAVICEAQTVKGSIAGIVADKSGAVVPGVSVLLRSAASSGSRQTLTGPSGEYRLELLDPGSYNIEFQGEGFEASKASVQVLIAETTRVNATLVVKGSKEQVTVTADPVLQDEDATTGRVIEQQTIRQLPLANRNFTQLLSLSPGTFASVPDNSAVGLNSQNISVNGSRPTNNNLSLNGTDANQIGLNNAANLPVPATDTLQEFKVQTSLYDASTGRSGGGAIAAITKSGDQQYHGNIYEFFRNDDLNANNYFFKQTGTPRPVLKRNQFGATLGGPVWIPKVWDGRKSNTFFFLSYQGSREVNGASIQTSVTSVVLPPGLTDANRTADGLAATFGIPANSVSPQAVALLNAKLPSGNLAIPSPQTSNAQGTNYTASVPARFHEDQFNTNLDQQITAKNHLALKFFFINYPTTEEFLSFFDPVNAPNLPGFGASLNQRNRLFSIVDTHTITSTLVNEFRAGYGRVYANFHQNEPLSAASVGISRFNESIIPGLPSIQVNGSFRIGQIPIFDVITGINTFTYGDTLSWTKGRHSLRFGAEFRRSQENFLLDFYQRGTLSFLSFQDFLQGNVFLAIDGSGIFNRNFRNFDWSGFAQDDFRVTPQLTLNLGLRYEVDGPPSDTEGRLATFDPRRYRPGNPPNGFVLAGNAAPQYRIPGVPLTSKTLLDTSDYNNLAPRVGFAFTPFASRPIVMRGGYGIFYSRISNEAAEFSFVNPPFAQIGVALFTPLANPFPTLPLPSAFPITPVIPTVLADGSGLSGAAVAGYALDPRMATPYMQQYGLDMQWEALHNLVFDVGYSGSRGVKLLRRVGIAQPFLASPGNPVNGITVNTAANAPLRSPYPGLSPNGFVEFETSGASNYNSLQLSATQRLSHGLQFLMAYTYSKSLDDAASGTILGDSRITSDGDQHNLNLNYGPSDYDRTHRFVGSLVYNIPGISGSGLAHFVTSGWETNFIANLQSGTPLDIQDTSGGGFYGGSNPNTGIVSRANLAPGADIHTAKKTSDVAKRLDSYFAQSAFVSSGNLFGTIGRNILRGPGQKNLDASIVRNFGISKPEGSNVEFRAEFFNALNFANFANPGTDFASQGTFGVITATSTSPRLIQFALKYNF